MRNLSRAVVLFLLFLFFPIKSILAENLLIVAVQIAGEISSNDFIKIYNPADNDLDISGYKLRKRASTGGESSIRVLPGGSLIRGKGYFLWANSKENFHLIIGADVWSTATLAKNNSIALFNPERVIIDAIAWGESQNPFSEGNPFPENPSSNQRLERKQIAGVYQDINNNSQDFYLNPPSQPPPSGNEVPPEEGPQLQPEPESQPKIGEPQPGPELAPQEILKSVTYPYSILINEILPSPTGPDETEELIEIFNQNNFEVDLSDWKIEDTMGKITTYAFPKGTKIAPLGFLVLSRPTTKIALNNDGDGLILIQPDGKIVDSVNYEKAPRGQSYNRTDSKWTWSTTLTPGSANIIPAPLSETKEAEPSKKELKEETEKGLAVVSEPFQQAQDKQISKFFLPFLIALALAIFSGIIILILKKKIKTK